MPYRIKAGQEVLLSHKNGSTKNVIFNRTVDFDKGELLCSPLDEHQSEGIPEPFMLEYPWGISTRERWEDVGGFTVLYAKEVHELPKGGATPENINTVVVKGSGTNQYTLTIDEHGCPTECTCRGFRFKRRPCKHMRNYL